MGIAEVLTCIFVVMKLLGKIAWSWWMVFSPLWITYGVVLILIAIWLVFVMFVVGAKK